MKSIILGIILLQLKILLQIACKRLSFANQNVKLQIKIYKYKLIYVNNALVEDLLNRLQKYNSIYKPTLVKTSKKAQTPILLYLLHIPGISIVLILPQNATNQLVFSTNGSQQSK